MIAFAQELVRVANMTLILAVVFILTRVTRAEFVVSATDGEICKDSSFA